MKTFLLAFILFVSIAVTAQSSFSETEAKALVDTFFEGFHTGDTTLMKSVLAKDVRLQTAATDNNGDPQVSNDSIGGLLNAIANRPADQKWEERLLSYTVNVDGKGHVWTPYEFWFNGNFSHCGANAFTIARVEGGWKIIHLIDSRRKEGCKQ